MLDAEVGVLTGLVVNDRKVLITLDCDRLFQCIDVRESCSFPGIGLTVSLALGKTQVYGARSLDWVWSNDVRETLKRERDAPAG